MDIEIRKDGVIIYRVKTPGDENHLSDRPIETQDLVLDWVLWNFCPAQKLYLHQNSISLKQVLQKRTQIYLSNNQFKEANWCFHIQASSPAIKLQADGYPGLPIIGHPELDEYGS